LSALPLMCRTAIIAVALAALTAAGAYGAQVSQAKAHRKLPAVAGSRATHRAAASRLPQHAHITHARTIAAHRATADEVGEAAGLAIRRQIGQRQLTRRHVAQRTMRARFVRVSATAQRSRSLETEGVSQPMEGAADLADSSFRTRDTGEMQPAVTASALPRESTRTQAPLQESENSGYGPNAPAARSVLPERAPDSSQQEMNAASENNEPAESDASDAAELPRASRTAKAAGDEIASLNIPRGAMPAPLRGSLASLERQNTRLDAEGLERIEDEADLAERIAHKMLVPVPISSALAVNAELPENHRYCRPWTANFLADLARAHEKAFHRPLEVSSAVRTVEYQKRLMETNGNAAAAEGDIVSPHLTGATVDIAKEGLTRGELAWMRRQLADLEAAGKIDVEEEFKQACFHITVYKDYLPAKTPRPGTHQKSGPPATGNGDESAPDVTAAQGL
jgi:hypothetical protein